MITPSAILNGRCKAVAIVASTLMVFNKRTAIVGKIALVLKFSSLEGVKYSQLGSSVISQVA